MSVGVGFTAEEIREVVHEYQLQPHGQKEAWLKERGVSPHRLRRWRSVVFEGDLDRGLVPRDGGRVTIPPRTRTGLERERARERAAHDAEVAALNARISELEGTNTALGKAIGLLHEVSAQEPDDGQDTTTHYDS